MAMSALWGAARSAATGSPSLETREWAEFKENAIEIAKIRGDYQEAGKHDKLAWGHANNPIVTRGGMGQATKRTLAGWAGATSAGPACARKALEWAQTIERGLDQERFSLSNIRDKDLFGRVRVAFLTLAKTYRILNGVKGVNVAESKYTEAAQTIFRCLNKQQVSVHLDIASRANQLLSPTERAQLVSLMTRMYPGWPDNAGDDAFEAMPMPVGSLEATLPCDGGGAGEGAGGAGAGVDGVQQYEPSPGQWVEATFEGAANPFAGASAPPLTVVPSARQEGLGWLGL